MGGDVRVKTAFLFWPRRIGRTQKWLETATWQEQYDSIWNKWKARMWMDGPEASALSSVDVRLRKEDNFPRTTGFFEKIRDLIPVKVVKE